MLQFSFYFPYVNFSLTCFLIPCFLSSSFCICLCLSGHLCPLLGFVWTSDAFATPAPATEASAAAAEGGAAATSAPAANAGAGGWLKTCLCVWVSMCFSQWWKATKYMCTCIQVLSVLHTAAQEHCYFFISMSSTWIMNWWGCWLRYAALAQYKES